MKNHGAKNLVTTGKNENGENVILIVGEDYRTTETLQSNGWIRVNTYWADGTTEEAYKR